MASRNDTDRSIRAITDDGGFRLIAVALHETIADAVKAQSVMGEVATRLAELMVGSVLLRETTAPGRRVQIAMRDERGGRLIADSLPSGLTRGIVNPGTDAPATASKPRIEVTYTLPNGALHKGIVGLSGEPDISAALMTYLQESEQILTTISVAAVARDDAGIDAVGFVVQLLPELERTDLQTMTNRLGNREDLQITLEAGAVSPTAVIGDIFDGFEHTILAESEIRFGCNCSQERILAGLSSLAETEIASMKEAGETLEVHCDACGKTYAIAPEML